MVKPCARNTEMSNSMCFKSMLRFYLPAFVLIFCTSQYSLASETHNPEQILSKLRGSKNEGKDIVGHFCASCHAFKPLIELGAPKIGSIKDWKARLKQGSDVLLQHTEEGIGAMPARGGCFECTDEQLQLAIESMLPD